MKATLSLPLGLDASNLPSLTAALEQGKGWFKQPSPPLNAHSCPCSGGFEAILDYMAVGSDESFTEVTRAMATQTLELGGAFVGDPTP